jgi:NADH-quinone oxidoreductase subunit N
MLSQLSYAAIDNMGSLRYYLPEFSLVGVFLVVFFLDLVTGRRRSRWTGPVALVGLAVVAWITLETQRAILREGQAGVSLFFGMVVADPVATFFKIVFVLATGLTILMSWRSRELEGLRLGEFYGLLLLICIGLFLMASSSNLLMFYISLEIVSYLSYVLVGFVKGQLKSSEAALKYVLYGSVSSGIMLVGISILYGLTGTLDLRELAQALAGELPRLPLLLATLFVMVGIGYKVSAVPFHFWTPDVYEGSNTPMTAFLSVGSKAAGFALLIRFVFFGSSVGQAGSLSAVDWQKFLAILSVATMTLGNLVAIHQRSIKRLLAYSSIAHAGYMLMGLATLTRDGLFAALFYIVVYLFMNLGAFLVVISLRGHVPDEDDIASYVGLGARYPAVAVLMGIFLFSLTGIPPLAGFIGKFYLFAAVIRAGLYELALIGVLNSVVSLFYYARILRAMFLERAEEGPEATGGPVPLYHRALLGILAVPTLLFGIYWGPLAGWVEQSVRFLF